MTTTEIFNFGDDQVVKLPQGFEFPSNEVAIRRDGEAVILEPIKSAAWPANFFESIRIDDPAFERPVQGDLPDAPSISPG